jgi:hypothetical protein
MTSERDASTTVNRPLLVFVARAQPIERYSSARASSRTQTGYDQLKALLGQLSKCNLQLQLLALERFRRARNRL